MRIPICGCETDRLPSVTLVVRIDLKSGNYILTQNRHVTKKCTNIKTITHTLTQESYTPPMSIYQPLMCYHILFFNSPLQPGNLWSETMFHDWYSCKDGIFMNRRANSSYFYEAVDSTIETAWRPTNCPGDLYYYYCITIITVSQCWLWLFRKSHAMMALIRLRGSGGPSAPTC